MVLLLAALATAQQAPASKAAPAKSYEDDVSGMYTFLEEGEFVQINVTPAEAAKEKGPRGNVVTGFVSRFGDTESDKGAFLDQFFSKGTLYGSELTFTTKPVHGVWFEFKGKLERGAAKTRAQEGYYVIRGTLKRFTTDANKKTTSQSREATFKSFPDLDAENPGD